MPRKQPVATFTVGWLFNEVQKSAAAHKKCSKLLWELQQQDSDDCLGTVVECLEHVLLVSEKDPHIERVLRFLAVFASERPTERGTEADAFVEEVMAFLVDVSAAADKCVRFRACQLLAGIMAHLHEDAELSEELAGRLQEAMLERLDDKQPAVRVQAVLVLTRLADPGQDMDFAEDPITAAFSHLLGSDRSKDVRKAVLGSLAVSNVTAVDVITRTRDVNDEVRRVAFLILASKWTMESLSIAQRSTLLKRGLSDRSHSVQAAATALLRVWLDQQCLGDVLVLLGGLDVESYEAEAEAAILALIGCQALDPVALAHETAQGGSSLRSACCGALLSPEVVLLWRVLCQWLHGDAETKGLAAAATSGAVAAVEAAAASDRLEALEAALPATVAELMAAAAAAAAAGSQHRYATRQLLTIASQCVDLTDATGRRAGAELLQGLLQQPDAWAGGAYSGAEEAAWRAALLRLARQVHAAPVELAGAFLKALQEVMQAAGINQDPSFDGGDGAHSGEAEGWLQGLAVAGLLLGALPTARVAPSAITGLSVPALLERLLYPAMQHAHPVVRREAVRCLGLYCLLDGTPGPHVRQAALLRTALAADVPAVRLVAAQALCDLALARGPKAVDALQKAVEPGLLKADPGARPLLELLLSGLQRSVDDLGRQNGSRASKRATATDVAAEDDAECIATAITEGLARLLLHHHLWLAPQRSGPSMAMEDGDVAQVLVQLLVLGFDPATAPRHRLRQCLHVFFGRYAALAPAQQSYLAVATLPAARAAAALPPAGGTGAAARKGAQALLLLRFSLQLLQVKLQGGQQAPCHADLAERLAAEALSCPKTPAAKPYIATLCKVLAGLPLVGLPQEALKKLRAVCGRLESAVSDRMAAKDIVVFGKKLAALDETPAEGLDAESLQLLWEACASQADADPLLAQFPLPFGDVLAATPSRSRARQAQQEAEDSSDDDEDEAESTPVVVRRQLPARSARTAKKLVDHLPSPVSEHTQEENDEAEPHPAAADSGSDADGEPASDSVIADSDGVESNSGSDAAAAIRRLSLGPGAAEGADHGSNPTAASEGGEAGTSSDDESSRQSSHDDSSGDENATTATAAKSFDGGRKSRSLATPLRDNVRLT